MILVILEEEPSSKAVLCKTRGYNHRIWKSQHRFLQKR
ncbi:hypothetical protein BT93_C0265 [Corymbia citriodora subsp. variegata]|nr:hypothetical protein BT93_C0265 [Corymbia citriodora subsp. variegata]